MILKTVIALLVLATLALAAYIRLAPIDAERLHRDPVAARDPSPGGVRVVPPEARVFDLAPDVLMARLDSAVLATPRTRRIGGTVDEGHVTYLTRSLVWGFPDVMSLRVIPVEGGTAVAAWGRSIYGGYDWNTNQGRLTAWLDAVAQSP